jgi:aldehyde:ferredoxin oxidoreductase
MGEQFGWAGTILFIDLSNGRITRVPTTEYRPEEFMGGVGLNTKIFWELECPEVKAFHPNNPIIISAGPLTGTYGPFGRGLISTISPQCYPLELFAYSSFGGRFASELKFAGYDTIVILGRSEKPVYLSIQDEEVRIKRADKVWGMDTFLAQQTLLADEVDASILVIGPAGENLSRIAIILNETNFAAGQGGFGAVMGSKNLKAIAVKGTSSVKVARPYESLPLIKMMIEENKKVEDWVGRFRGPYTTPKETQEIFARNYYVKQIGCYGCPRQCVSIHHIPEIGLSGAKCGDWQWAPMFCSAPKDIWEANVLMQKLGLNSFDITCGIPVLLYRAHKAGVLSTKEIEEDIGFPAPQWLGGQATDHQFLSVFFHKVANGEIPYSQGTPRFTDYFKERLSNGKGLMNLQKELYTARGYAYHHMEDLGSALHWATDTRNPIGSSHEYRYPFRDPSPEVMEHFGFPPYSSYQIRDLTKTSYEKVEIVTKWVQEHQCLKNSLTLCEFWTDLSNFYHPPEMDIRIFESSIFSAITGINMNPEQLAHTGERIWNLRRAVMVRRENRTREDDTLNEPYFEKSITCPGGVSRGLQNGPIDRVKFERLKDKYYELRGWDVKTGRPTRGKLEELGLKEVADKLTSLGKLP